MRNAPVPVPVEPDTSRTVEQRLEEIVGAIQEFASLRFDARAPVGPDGDIVDAVAAGVNFLGEELGAAFSEIERRVADRTAELEIATRALSRRALHDELTGLPNRVAFWEHLSHRLVVASRRRAGFAVLFLDLDGFKTVNDSLGHAAGDELLVTMAARVSAELREDDLVGRIGGDEFVVLLDDVATTEAALLVAERLSAALRIPYRIGAQQRSVPASIGVALGPNGDMTADDLVAAADAAMYDAKRRGGGQSVLYREHLHGRRGRPRDDPPGRPAVRRSSDDACEVRKTERGSRLGTTSRPDARPE